MHTHDTLEELIAAMEHTNATIRQLQDKLDALKTQVITICNHTYESAQRSYTCGDKKITIATGYNYTILPTAKRKWLTPLAGQNSAMPRFSKSSFAPIQWLPKPSIKDIKAIECYGTPEDNLLLAELIQKTDRKPSVVIAPSTPAATTATTGVYPL